MAFLLTRNSCNWFRQRFMFRSLANAAKNYEVVLKEVSTPSELDQDKSETALEKVFQKAAEQSEQEEWDWDTTMHIIRKSEDVLPPHKPTGEELIKIRASRPTATLASLINESKTLQRLVDIGVNLSKWEKRGEIGLAVKLDFKRDVIPVIKLLSDIGVYHDKIGNVLTHCPSLLEIPEEDLKVRVAYMVSKKFSKDDISKIVACSPSWLTYSVKGIDGRLGFLQKTFGLTGNEVRHLAINGSRLVTLKNLVPDVKKKIFTIKEEMGFSEEEMKEMVLADPMLYMKRSIQDNIKQFELLHIQAEFPHELLAKFPSSLRRSHHITEGRHKFLKFLGKAEYQPDQPNYVSPTMLTEGTDEEFCETVARCDIELYYKFLRTI